MSAERIPDVVIDLNNNQRWFRKPDSIIGHPVFCHCDDCINYYEENTL